MVISFKVKLSVPASLQLGDLVEVAEELKKIICDFRTGNDIAAELQIQTTSIKLVSD